MRNIIYIPIILFFLFFSSLIVSDEVQAAHKLKDLQIHTYIHEDGSATITEIRDAELSEGTENYDVIENLGKSKIKDFTVKEAGKTYQFIDKWDIDANREKKANKNSIIKTSGGYELVWGIGEYGQHTYELQYTVTDFIKETKSGEQILFWRYVNDKTNIPPENLTIEIEADKSLTNEDEKIWGFGFEGDIEFSDGKVIAQSDQALSSSDYATVLISFPEDLFQTNDRLGKTFEEIKDEAFKGSDYESKNKLPNKFTLALISILPFIPIVLVVGGLASLIYIKFIKVDKLSLNRRKFEGEYERELPLQGDFADYYYLLLQMKVAKLEQLISAYILKWIKEERISITEEEVGIFFKTDQALIIILNREINSNDLENRLFHMLIEAEYENNRVSQSDFSRYIEKNRSLMRRWEKDVEERSRDTLVDLGIYEKVKKKRLLLFPVNTYAKTEMGEALETKVFKYMNYLEDYSLLNEHEAINVTIWDELMITAAILGITDKVYKQFKELYPKYTEESIYTHTMITGSSEYGTTVSEARSYIDRSGGGGGSISSGGGGGSFGGGSGGGTR